MEDNLYQKYRRLAEDYVARMTVKEKISQLCNKSAAIERLGIPEYNWWNEGLHGVGRAGRATVFPQAIGLAAAFDRELLFKVGQTVANEGRIKYNLASRHGDRGIYKGLTFWSPNVNIFRDPRWGRGQETYGEDPYLTGQLAVQFISGVQECEDGQYMKASACAKHFAAHSGPEETRHSHNSRVSRFDLYDTYLPAFEAAVKEAKVSGVMGAYNLINGEHCCTDRALIQGVLRDKWGFDGYFVSDAGAIKDIHLSYKLTESAEGSAARALKAGCNLCTGGAYGNLPLALEKGWVTETDIDAAVTYLYTVRAALGMFDDQCSYNGLTDIRQIESAKSLELSYRAACESVVLLKNNGLLPLKKEDAGTIAVIGPNAASIRALQGNYNGTATRWHTLLDGLSAAYGEDAEVLYARGSHLYKKKLESCGGVDDGISEAVTLAENSDAVVLCLGLDSSIEGEQGDAGNEYGAGDNLTYALPESQLRLLRAVKQTGKPVVTVILAGCALDLREVTDCSDAVLYGWYPGSEGGRAIADILCGKVCPSGRLPVTVYRDINDLPDYESYDMRGRTYRYFDGEALYPFGYGLSYTTFSFANETADAYTGENPVAFAVDVTNTGGMAAEKAVLVFAHYGKEKYITPHKKLCGFGRVALAPGETKKLLFRIPAEAILLTDESGQRYKPHTVVFHAE